MLESSSSRRRKWNQDLASPGGPQASRAARAGDPQGHHSALGPGPAWELAHPSLQPQGFKSPLKDFPIPVFLLLFPPTEEMPLAGDPISCGFALPIAGWHTGKTW